MFIDLTESDGLDEQQKNGATPQKRAVSTAAIPSDFDSPEYFIPRRTQSSVASPTARPVRAPRFKVAGTREKVTKLSSKRATSALKAAQAANVVESEPVTAPGSNPANRATKAATRTTTNRNKTIATRKKLTKATQDRKTTVKELLCTVHGSPEIEDQLKNLGVTVKTDHLEPVTGLCAFVSLSRRTTSCWDAALRAYVEGELHTEPEPRTVAILDAAKCPAFHGQPEFFAELDRVCGTHCIYIVEGCAKLLRNEVAAYNRRLQRRTRDALRNAQVEHSPLRPPPDAATHLRTQVHLQLEHGRNLIHCEKREESITWCMNLLQDISLQRYLNNTFVNVNPKLVKSQSTQPAIMTEALFHIPGSSRRMAEQMQSQFSSLGEVIASCASGGDVVASATVRDAVCKIANSMDPNEII